jgi:hypothetical protein
VAENPNSEQKRGADKVPQPRDRSASTYSRERLMGESVDFFGEPSHVVAGALAGLDARKQNFTLDEASDAIRAFHQRPVTSE